MSEKCCIFVIGKDITNKMNKIEEICNLMNEAGLDFIDFLIYRNRPTIQKEGIKYEILLIEPIDESSIHLTGIPSYAWCTKELYMDKSWSKNTINKINRIVKEKIAQYYE